MPESFFDEQSRVDKFNKRRKNTKLINVLIVVGVLLSVFLIVKVIFGGEDNKVNQVADPSENGELEDNNESGSDDNNSEVIPDDTAEPGEENSDQETPISEEEDTEETIIEETSDDPNVSKVIIRDWKPIGTVQEEPHVATYDDESVDWEEMWAAARYATGLSEDDEIRWWATNNGNEHKAKLTMSNKAQTNTYRVYVEWVTNEGWKPTKVEELVENDIKKEHFSGDSEDDQTDTESQSSNSEDVQPESEE